MLPTIPLKTIALTCFLIVTSSYLPANADNTGKPLIAMSDIKCGGFYLIEIFENGNIEFHSSKRWKLGILYRSQINRKKLDELVKKFIQADFMAADNREPYSGIATGAIRFRQDENGSTVISPSTSANPLIKDEIIEATHLKQWLPDMKTHKFPDEKNKRVEPCMSRDITVAFEQLRLSNP